MSKRVIFTDRLMQPIAHFSHAVRVGDLLHVGATAGTDADRRLAGLTPGLLDATAQTSSMFDNMETVLALLGGSPSELVRLKLYVTDVRDMARCQAMCAERYGASGLRPVIAGSAGFPLPHAAVELDAVALVGARPSTMETTGAVVRCTSHRAYIAVLPMTGSSSAMPADAQAQAEALARNLQAAVEAAGMVLTDLVNLHVTVADLRDLAAVDQALASVLREPYPACAVVEAALGDPAMRVQVEAQCVRGGGVPVTAPGCRSVLTCASSAVLAGDELYIGAQTGMVNASRADDVETQARSAFAKVEALLDKAGMATANLLRTNNILVDWRDYAGFNAGYGSKAVAPYPPRTTVLGGLAVPGARVQIEGVAHRNSEEFVVVDRPVG